MADNVSGSSTSINDLDLLDIDNQDTDKLVSRIESFYKLDSIVKSQLSYHWVRNHMMLDGQQWLVFDQGQSGGEWRRLEPAPTNDYIPRPVTNYMWSVYQTLKSYILKNKPRSSVRPNTQTHSDKQAAKIAEMVVEANWERLNEDFNFEYAASCLITYGTVFKKDYWDTSYLSVAKVPKLIEVPRTDPNTGDIVGYEQVEQRDEIGNVVYDEIPLGDVNTSVIEPFRIVVDPVANSLHDCRWIMEYSIRPLSWIKENYSSNEPGYTGKAEEVKEEKSLSSSMRRYFRLKTSSGVRGSSAFPGVSTESAGSDIMIENAAIVKEYYERPTFKHPKGRLIVVANKVVLYVGDSPYEGNEQGSWHPYSMMVWEPVPGRIWGKSPLDEVAELQRQINSIDSIIILTRKTMAVPQKLIPHGSSIPPSSWTGRPGLTIGYRATGGEKPEIIPPVGVDAQVFQERAQKVSDIKEISGAVDILKGDRPPGVNAASALAMLFEVGTGKLFPILDRWKKFIENSQKKQLKMISKKYREPRPEFIRMLMSKNKDLTEEQIKNFIGTDLHDNVNVVIEAASSIPKLKAAEHATLLELAQYGVLGLENPQNRRELLDRFGVNGFDSGLSLDVQRAEDENSIIENLEKYPDKRPVVLETDDHAVHKDVHSQFTKHPKFMAMPSIVQQALFEHIYEHEQMVMQKEQEQMMQQMAMGIPMQPQPQQGQSPTQTPPTIRTGGGVSDKIQKTLLGDMMGPGGQLTSG